MAVPGLLRRIVGEFDPRYDPRVKERERLMGTQVEVTPVSEINPDLISIADLEGRSFVTSMSDRTAAGGLLSAINDVALENPVRLRGGQDYMFENPGQVWASANNPVNQIMRAAQATGGNPIYLPWSMAPTGGDFATMTGETMLSFAASNMSKTNKKAIDAMMRKYNKEWKGVDNPVSIEQFRSLPDSMRKTIMNEMDVRFRDKGGLSLGQARLAVSDPAQQTIKDARLRNVGEIFSGADVIPESGHPSYPKGVPGQGLGRIKEDISVFDVLPETVKERGIPDPRIPRQTDIRALQMKPYSGRITESVLKNLQSKGIIPSVGATGLAVLANPDTATANAMINEFGGFEAASLAQREAQAQLEQMTPRRQTGYGTMSGPRNAAAWDVGMAAGREGLSGTEGAYMAAATGNRPGLLDALFSGLELGDPIGAAQLGRGLLSR